MNQIIDRLLLLAGCLFMVNYDKGLNEYVLILLIAISISEFNFAIQRKWFWYVSMISYLVVCIFSTNSLVFLPLVLYDSVSYGMYALTGIGIAEYCMYFFQMTVFQRFYFFFLFLVMLSQGLRTRKVTSLHDECLELKDTSKELQIVMEARNREIQQNQDYQIHMATLQERNRIAREIHDNVGHMLSRSILMVGATMAINQDAALQQYLTEVKTTLDDAMNSIRSSVHDLHDDAIDLRIATKQLVDEFLFCPIDLDYDMGKHVDRKVTLCFLAIMKEALTNVSKHSNASQVEIVMREHPAIYQLMIKDNGTKQEQAKEDGIGLENMQERVRGLKGTVNITKEQGYHVFVMIPKEKQIRES